MRQSHLILFNATIMWVSRVLLLVPQLILVPYLLGTRPHRVRLAWPILPILADCGPHVFPSPRPDHAGAARLSGVEQNAVTARAPIT